MSASTIAAITGVDVAMLAVIFVLLLVLIFLAVAEMGLSRMTKPKAHALADEGKPAGPALVTLVEHPESWINPLLLTVNICQTVQATLTGIVAGRLFGGWGVVVGVVLNVVVFFVLAEAVPKTYAVLHAERAALATARPVKALVSFPPLRFISRGLIGLTNVIVRGDGLSQGPFVSESELLGIVEAAAEDEVIEDEERELIESIIEFGDTVAREVMVPRPDVVIIDHDATVTGALDLAIAHGYSRLPVAGEEDMDVVGLAYTKDLMRAERDGRGDVSVIDLARPVRFVPENKLVSQLMREMQDGKFHAAIVADEYGQVEGMITLEDCLEELVGEIVDEYDVEEFEIERLPSGDFVMDGGYAVDEFNDMVGDDLPNDDWESIGGLLFNTLGHVPAVGEAAVVGRWRLIAQKIDGRRIRQVKAHHLNDAEFAAYEAELDAKEAAEKAAKDGRDAQTVDSTELKDTSA